MLRGSRCRWFGLAVVVVSYCVGETIWAAALQVTPAQVSMRGNFAQTQVLVRELNGDGKIDEHSNDLTPQAKYESSNLEVFTVDAAGRLFAVGNGAAVLRVVAGDATSEIPVMVEGIVAEPAVDFDRDVRPLISKAGCNMGACHASQHGKGGFTLSVFGFDPGLDYQAIVRDREQRRVNFIEPEASLLLQKPSMRVSHGGGLRLPKDSPDYRLLVAWLRNQAPGPKTDAAEVTRLTVTPAHRVGQADLRQQLRVEALYSDGSVRDVTAWARFDSMDEGTLSVAPTGLVSAVGKGQAPVMVRFEGQAQIATFVIPFQATTPLAGWTNQNFIDELAAQKFQQLGIEPSPLADDATFVRRVFLDCIGTLPKPEEVVAFLQSTEPNKRERLIDRLLGLTGDPNLDTYNEQYSAYWTLKWSDLIRNTSDKLGEQGMWAMHNWIRDSFRSNRPFDQFVRELVTGKGSIYSNGPANYFRVNDDSSALTEATTQLFLGIRLECAKCHHHPFEKYSQADYYGFAAFFARVGTKRSEEFGLFGGEQVVVVQPTGEVRHPKTGKNMTPTPLDGEPVDHPLDRRIALAEWLTAQDNAYFARSVVNRYMYYLLGRGLVHPVDDLRSTNPPTNVALMDALAKDFVDKGFNLKQLVRVIVTSRLYQLEARPTEQNAADDRFYSHFKVKRLPAETLLDSIDQVTGIPTKHQNLPPGTRAIELPDAEYPNYFLNTFAKPRRASVCECERSPDESLSQALHTLNGDTITTKMSDKNGRLAQLTAAGKPHDEIITELYLATVSRYPTEQELAASRQFVTEYPTPLECYEDLLWALLNSKQFLFVH